MRNLTTAQVYVVPNVADYTVYRYQKVNPNMSPPAGQRKACACDI